MIYIIPTDTCFWIACSISDIKNYEKIYKIKKRDYSKPLAIMVPNFEWLEKYSDLNKEQINFLKKYDKPFTILCDSSFVKLWIHFVNEDTKEEFRNREVYEKIAFRVANNKIQKKLLKEVGPIFLTSANVSNRPEIYKTSSIREEFWDLIKKWAIKFYEDWNLKETKASEIFEFEGETTNQIFLRK